MQRCVVFYRYRFFFPFFNPSLPPRHLRAASSDIDMEFTLDRRRDVITTTVTVTLTAVTIILRLQQQYQ